MDRLCECHHSISLRWLGSNNFNLLRSKAYVSLGGLLMSLEGPYKKLTPLRVDQTYLLVKK